MLKVKVTVDKARVRELATKVVAQKVSNAEWTEMKEMEEVLYKFGGARQISLFENIVADVTNPQPEKAKVA